MRELERDGEHIWLRQSVTFTVDGQTRTLEIAVPLRPGAASGELEALLREAQAGMDRLTRDLDAQVAAIANGTPLPATPAPPPIASAPAHVEAAPSEPAAPATTGAPAPSGAAPHAPRPAPTSTPTAPPPPMATPAAPRAEPSTARAWPSGPLVREAAPPAAAPAGPPMDLREFLSTARGELDLTPPQIMSRLGVKSLSGINYREALENLRRQALRGEGSANPPAPASVPASRPASAGSAPQPVRYFEEELDEPEVTFSMDGDDANGAAIGTYGEAEDFEGDEDEYEDLTLGDDEEEVPDFGPPPTPAPAPRAATRPTHPIAAGRPATPAPSQPAEDGDGGERAYAMQLVGQMRGAKPGGTPSTQQRTAFRNIVVQELGAEKAKTVVQGLYRVPPERLGPEQLDALISWGKRDTFAEDADLVLAALRAERERAASGTSAAPSSAPPAPAANGTAPRTPTRGRAAPRTAPEG